ncbi:MAG: flagellar filament capping protein FliD [Porcipelethomonas sp.]
MNVSSSDTSTYTNAAYSSKGMSGLASGIDTESLVQSMLSGVQTKIDKQQQQKQVLEWKQEKYRSVIDDINNFQSKYFSLTSNTSLRLESFFNSIETSSTSSAVSVSAGSSAIDSNFNIQVARLATASSVTSSKVSSGRITTSTDKASDFSYSRTVDFKIGDTEAITVDLSGVSDASELCSRINDAVGSEFAHAETESVTIYKDADGNKLNYDEDSKKYTDSEGVEYTGPVTTETEEKITSLTFNSDEKFEITGSSAGMAILGLSSGISSSAAKDENGDEIENKFEFETKKINLNFAEKGKVSGTVDVTLDGVKKSIAIAEGESMDDFRTKLQNSFGKTVNVENDGSGWNISVAGTGRQISISASAETMEAIGFAKGTTAVSSQIIRTDSLEKLGIGNADDPDAKYSFSINGVDIEYTSADSVSSIMNKINSSSANVKMTYDELSDKFKLSSGSTGTGFDIKVTGDDEGLFSKLGFSMTNGDLDDSSVVAGQNAVVNINGVTVERANNSFTYNGISVNAKSVTGQYELNNDGTFAENSDGTLKSVSGTIENKAEISTSRNVDKIIDTIKSFVEDYNSLIEKLNGYTHEEASYKKYPPLTDAQKKEMTEKEIELWEEKSKEGLLRNDSDISEFLTDMRAVLYTKGADSKYALTNIGIDSSNQWQDYGKLTIDEDKLRSMLQSDAEGVKSVFIGNNGISSRLNDVCKKAANVSSGSPGSLVSLAGVVGKSTENNNEIKNQLDVISEKLKSLNELYETRKTRYWNQFNAMETAINNMNSQTSWLSQMMGY